MTTRGAFVMRKTSRGMTLVELLTVVAVIGILSAIAIPSYRGYITRTNRSDAKTSLLSTAAALERCYTTYNSYNAAGCTVVLPTASNEGKYQISATFPSGSQFVLTAAPQGKQATDDTKCGSFTMTEVNVRGISGGTGTATECWQK
jgi:type IV pilus assembly protein PilE